MRGVTREDKEVAGGVCVEKGKQREDGGEEREGRDRERS